MEGLLTESYITLTDRRDFDLYFYNPGRIIGWYRFHFMFINEIVEIMLDLIFTCPVLMPEFSCFEKKELNFQNRITLFKSTILLKT